MAAVHNALPMAAGAFCVIGAALFYRTQQEPTLVRAQSDAGQAPQRKKALVRRHSSGDHAFLPASRQGLDKTAAQKNFGVPQNLVQDGEGTRLPTTRGY